MVYGEYQWPNPISKIKDRWSMVKTVKTGQDKPGRPIKDLHPFAARLSYTKLVVRCWQCVTAWKNQQHLGLSENSVPLNPMVNDHYPY